jgi:predicted Zn-dependent protease
VFDSQRQVQNRQQRAGALYGLAYLALKRGQLAAASTWLQQARAVIERTDSAVFSTGQAASTGEAMFASLELEMLLASGQSAAAVADALVKAELAHQRYPLARGIARQYAEALIANGKLEQAGRFLREQSLSYREEAKLHDLLAKTYAAQGKLALQHMALAESYALAGSMLAALDQLSIARKAGDATFYDLSLIDARERQLQERRRAELEESKNN